MALLIPHGLWAHPAIAKAQRESLGTWTDLLMHHHQSGRVTRDQWALIEARRFGETQAEAFQRIARIAPDLERAGLLVRMESGDGWVFGFHGELWRSTP